MSRPWVAYGAGPVLAAGLGFVLPWLLLECLEATGMCTVASHGIQYRSDSSGGRAAAISKTQARHSWSAQLRASLWTVLGPGAVFNACISALLLPHLFATPLDQLSLTPPTWGTFLLKFLLCHVIGDLGLYWGHRIQHENKWLWENCHSVHHQLPTPTAVSTAMIHPVDMTLQASLPTMLAAVAVQAHPITYAAYAFSRVAENTFNHCGLDAWVIDVLTFKILPGRASVAHHDAHHKYSGYVGNAKNYGEGFWVWDAIFGTARRVRERPEAQGGVRTGYTGATEKKE